MTEREKMDKGLIYDPNDKEILEEQMPYINKPAEYNSLAFGDFEKSEKMLKETFGSIGKNCMVTPPFYANWGGKHVFIGDNFYSNFNLTLVDDGNIFIGNCVMIAPNVTITSAGHPVLPELRAKGLQFNADVRICDNVWIGAGALILPGVTIGENSVIGAGSVVTKDIPANVVAVGNPCKVLRKIGEKDKTYFFKDRVIPEEYK